MWKRTTVRCEVEGEGGGGQGETQPTGNGDRTDRLTNCREQGTMGAGTVLAQRGPAQLLLKPGVCPHFPFL